MRIIRLRRREQGIERIVARDDEAGHVGQELAAEVEDDEEEVEGDEADNGVRLGNRRLLLKVVEGGVLGQLSRQRRTVSLDAQSATEGSKATWPGGGSSGAALTSLSSCPT